MLDRLHKDYLTGFALRDEFYAQVKKLIIDCEARNQNFSIILFDIDHFKKYNDRFGHLCGDSILKYASGVMRLFFREDLCFRYGGDEFIIILSDKEPHGAYRRVTQLKNNMSNRPFRFENKTYKPFRITISCGIAGFPHDGRTIDELVRSADEAMYFSKHSGRNKTTLANNIKFIKLRNLFIIFISAVITFVSLGILYQFPLKNTIHRAIRDLRGIKITSEPTGIDSIILKNGSIIKGIIIKETEDRITLRVPLRRGEGTMVLKKSEIAEIRLAPTEGAP